MTDPIIMVDDMRVWPHATGIFRAGSAHLTTDGTSPEHLAALHAFADRIGLRREWFLPHKRHPHYDLTPAKREQALAAGAVYVEAKEQARAWLCSQTDPTGTPMKVLSVWCPWAQLIFFGKDVENRGWLTSYRGPLAIHASKGNHSSRECWDILDGLIDNKMITVKQHEMIVSRIATDRGHIIGVVQLVGAKRTSQSPWWAGGQCALELAEPRLLVAPIQHRGEQGMRDYVLPAGASFR